MTAVSVFLIGAVLACALAYAEDQHNQVARERIRRQEAEAWADHFEAEADTLRCENTRLREQLATVQGLHAERTRQLLAQNYWIIDSNVAWKRRRQQ